MRAKGMPGTTVYGAPKAAVVSLAKTSGAPDLDGLRTRPENLNLIRFIVYSQWVGVDLPAML